jgi:hypothetical protein
MERMILLGFAAGSLAVLVFHQGAAVLLHLLTVKAGVGAGLIGRVSFPYSTAAVPPFGVPQVISWAFWGGVWGVILAALLRAAPRLPDLLFGFLFGALVLTVVGFTLVAALKGLPSWAGGNKQVWWRVGLLNGAWGWGTALMLRPFRRVVR